ncbi:hypothetical protein TRVL_05427 [Trypanosoma vivax]|nr:hypothetical protein TRVL_05427 [Trypanosoma vivax]
MLFLLFLFLGTLGAQAEAKQAVCNMSHGNVSCSMHGCLTTDVGEAGANVSCTCKKEDTHVGSCTLEFHGTEKEDRCNLTSVGKTTSCKAGDKNCMTNCTESGLSSDFFRLDCDCTEGVQNKGKKAEGAQNQGKKAEGAQNQGKKAEGTQNQGKKAEGAQNQGKKAEGAQNQGNGNNEKPVPHESTVAQNANQLGEPSGTQNSTGPSSPPNGNAEQSNQYEKVKGGVSAATRNSQEAAYLYTLFSFIAVMPRRN